MEADRAERQGELQRVAGSGHYLQRDRPDAVAAAVQELLHGGRAAPPGAR